MGGYGKWSWLLGLVGAGLLIAPAAHAKDYFVATTGNDSNDGSLAMPFATLQKGADVAAAGDTVYIRGGTYKITTPKTSGAGVTFTKSGTSETNRIKYWAYQGEVPIFDFTDMVLRSGDYTHGFVVTGSWLHFKGLELRNLKMLTRSNSGIRVVKASHDIFELLNLHDLAGPGLFLEHGDGAHLILNSDAHDNYDPTSDQGNGQNADGFGVHYQDGGPSTVIRGCRAWYNSDDGYDFIQQEVPVIVENSWAMGNGYTNSGTTQPSSGNGNGFKAGSSWDGIRHVIRNSLAWKNGAAGFYANHSLGGNDWFNNTSYKNGKQFNMYASDPPNSTDRTKKVVLTGDKVHRMRNNIGFPNANADMEGVDMVANSWDLNLTPTAADFLSVDDTGTLGPRQADGSLPNVPFMKLSPTSQLIDKGVDVGLPSLGKAPDLGAYEYGAVTPPSGGSAGAGGTGGAGGGAGAGGNLAAGSDSGGADGGSNSSGSGNLAGAGAFGGNAAGTPAVAGSAGTPASGGGGDGPMLGTDPQGTASGCGCAVVGSPDAPGAFGVLASLLGAFAVGRRRARRRRA